MDDTTRKAIPKVILGILLIVAGTALMLDRLQVLEIGHLSQYWPVALLGVGASRLWSTWGTSAQGSGAGMMMLGLYFFAVSFKWFGLTYHNSWPLFLVAVGFGMVWRALVGAPVAVAETEEAPRER